MGKKREKRKVVRYIYEGELTERIFFNYLHDLYPQSEAKPIDVYCGRGGTANSQISNVLKVMHFDRIYLVLDEDFQIKGPIENDVLRNLENKWQLDRKTLDNVKYRDFINYNKGRCPIIIFSNPSSIEGIILQLLGKTKNSLEGKTTRNLKDQLSAFISQYFKENGEEEPHDSKERLMRFFKATFPKDLLESKRTDIKELDCILSIFE